jgi:predicted RNA-binding protein with PIN domain
MRNYQADVRAYSAGRGALNLKIRGYGPCHNAEEVILETGYDPAQDLANPTWSVFCAHGAGYEVPWQEVDGAAHLPLMSDRSGEGMQWNYRDPQAQMPSPAGQGEADGWERGYESYRAHEAATEELKQIFERTYGKIERKDLGGAKQNVFGGGRHGPAGLHKPRKVPRREPVLLVDGYNIIFAWDDLRELALRDIKSARDKLMDILSNFAGYRTEKVILVFDAYKVAGGPGEVLRWHNIDVVFTKEAETADLYIEKTAHVLAKKYRVTVATSDAVEQIIIFGAGAYRMSAQMLLEEILFTEQEMRERYAIGSDE